MSTWLVGSRKWECTRDDEGHREYKLTSYIRSDDPDDGPAVVLTTPGMPLAGSFWAFGNDIDPWATCRLTASVKALVDGEPDQNWEVTQVFSTKGEKKSCKEQQQEDPLLEPTKVSGGANKFTEEATHDRYGAPVVNSGWEQIRGAQNEWDANRPTVKIEMNVATLNLALYYSMLDTVNDAFLWGVGPRRIKLSNFTWERKYHGACNVYYTVGLEFEVNARGWDRDLLDEGTKVISGEWNRTTGAWDRKAIGTGTLNPDLSGVFNNALPINPDPNKPTHFIRFKDRRGENTSCIYEAGGTGKPWVPPASNAPPADKWWCISTAAAFELFEGTCTEAVQRATAQGGYLDGPHNSQAEAESNCGLSSTDIIGNAPWTFTCTDVDAADSSPSTVHVEKYLESNFLFLGIPVTL